MISGKRLVRSATDIFVGWDFFYGRDYYLRQFRDMKIIPETEHTASLLATACGNALACAHARGGDPMAISSYRGNGAKFAAAIGQFARAYADQSVRDLTAETSWDGPTLPKR